MRATRKARKRLQAQAKQRAAWYQTAAVVAVGSLILLPTSATEASSVLLVNEIPAAFQELLAARNRIRDFHEAKRNAQEASEALAQAESVLQQARLSQQEAVVALETARQNLAAAQARLKAVAQELEEARRESAQRTQDALTAQRAVADFLPNVWKQETVVQELESDRSVAQQRYEYLTGGEGGNTQSRKDLAARIEAAWQSVNYEQNRLADVMAMVHGLQQDDGQGAEVQEFEERLQEIDTAIEAEESQLDQLNSQLEALEGAREAAEDAEQEARDRVLDFTQEQSEAESDVREGEKDCEESAVWKQETDAEVFAGQQELQETRAWKTQADYDLEHFGSGAGIGIGFEYYSWRGTGDAPLGHQLYQPIEAYVSEKQWDFSLLTGWLESDTGLKDGYVSGWTDTVLAATYKNDHAVNDVHYGLAISVPTGKEDVHQNAMMADNLARYNSFGEGWQLTPSIEAIHHITERDSLHARLLYAFRGNYEYRSSYQEKNDWQGRKSDLESLLGSSDIREAESVEEIDPGRQFRQEAEYRHIGDSHQFSLQLAHTNATQATSRTKLRCWIDAAGSTYSVGADLFSDRNEDGQDWTVRLFDNYDVDAKNSFCWYGIANYQESSDGGMHRYYGGLGWQHQFNKERSAYILLNYGETHGQSYNWHLAKWEEGRRIKSVILGYNHRLNERDELVTKYEQYIINGSDNDTYHGWNTAVMFHHSF